MSQWDKLIARILKLAKDLRFDEVKKVLERYGYTDQSPSGGSSHHTFRKPGCDSTTIPEHSPVKRAYVKMVRDIIEAEAEENKDDEDD